MKSIATFFLLLFSVFLTISCGKEKLKEVRFTIPVEDRCVFAEGDVLHYRCSDGSTDTVFVNKVEFKTETGTYSVWGADMHNFSTQIQEIRIEASNDNWIYGDIESSCFIIQSLPKYDDLNTENFPRCALLNGCEHEGSLILADKLAETYGIEMDGKIFEKVYYFYQGGANDGFEVYWNLKYGIIRFVGKSNGTKLTWQLEI